MRPRPIRRRDWYWLLGRLGQSLIVLGILMFLFVGYQLWGTGIEESQAQNRLEDTFFEYASQIPDDDIATGTLPSSANDSGPNGATANDAPTFEVFQTVAVDEGDPVAIIDIPALGVTKYVVAGVAAADLKKGPGHYPTSPQPGHLGNVAIAGHRTTYGEPFRRLDDLELGDDIVMTDVRGREFVYEVTDAFVVNPDDSWVVATTDPTRALLTLTTCHPEFSAKQRLIVTAELDASRSSVVDDRPFRYPSDPQPVDVTESTVATESSVSSESTPTTDTVPATTMPSEIDPATTVDDFGVDTFGEGWFSDSAAWPHVLGWVAALLTVVFGGWWVHRRSESRLLAVVVAIAPFFVVLYFVFQNVNRLLPPNL